MSDKKKIGSEDPDAIYKNWRMWGSWFSWGSPVGLGIFIALGAFGLWLIKN